MDETGIVVMGGSGRMGRMLCALIQESETARLVGVTEAPGHPWAGRDYGEVTEHGGYIIHGRSDAVLNPGGVRIGTAEIYRQVERIEDVVEKVLTQSAQEGLSAAIAEPVWRKLIERDDLRIFRGRGFLRFCHDLHRGLFHVRNRRARVNASWTD